MSTNNKTPATINKEPAPYFYIEEDDEAKVAEVYIFGNIAPEAHGLGRLFRDPSERSA